RELQPHAVDRVQVAVVGVEVAHDHRAPVRLDRPGGLAAGLGSDARSCSGRVVGHVEWLHAKRLLRETRRATVVRIRMRTTRASAAPQARWTWRSWAWPTSLKIWAGSEIMDWLGLVVRVCTIPTVKSSGAVSPAARAIASKVPVTSPG